MTEPTPTAAAAEARAAAGRLVHVWRRIMTDPRGFYADMPQAGGLREPLVFLAACAAVEGLGRVLAGHGLAALPWTVVAVVVGAFVLAAILVLVAQHLFDGRAGFEPTFRAVAYAAAPVVLAWVPRLGVLALLWACFLVVRGLERVQEMGATNAVLSAAIGVGVLLVLGIGLGG